MTREQEAREAANTIISTVSDDINTMLMEALQAVNDWK